MSLVYIKVVYSYYSSERVTPIFLSKNLLEPSHDAFKNRVVNKIPHLRKKTDMTTLRATHHVGPTLQSRYIRLLLTTHRLQDFILS